MTQGPRPRIDWPAFGLSVAIMLVVSVPLAVAPEAGGETVRAVYEWIAENLGLFYQWALLGSMLLLAWLALGRYGHLKLGRREERPEFSDSSWIAMLFCAGVGAGLMYWSVVEWAYYVETPPYGIEPGSSESLLWASSYGVFHWGLSAWCLYCLPTLAIALPYYRYDLPSLRLSTGLFGLLGDRTGDSPAARLVDVVFVLALLGGAGTSLGLATPMIAAVVARVFDFEASFGTEVAIVAVCAATFAASVSLGLHRGIKRLSTLNTALALALLAFVLVVGPTLFLLRLSTESVGFMLQNFARMNTYTDAIDRTGWVEDWSVFYWAWWIAYGPFMGVFAARISRGRTVRQLILGMTLLGSLGCAVFYFVLGNFALHQELVAGLPIRELVAAGNEPEAIVTVLASLPLFPFALVLFGFVALVFAATTYDSGSYALAATVTRNLEAGQEPGRAHRVFWAFALGVLPVTLMAVGGLRAIQSAVLVASLPVLAVGVLMVWSLFRTLKDCERQDAGEPQETA